jgi:hypothetical protein
VRPLRLQSRPTRPHPSARLVARLALPASPVRVLGTAARPAGPLALIPTLLACVGLALAWQVGPRLVEPLGTAVEPSVGPDRQSAAAERLGGPALASPFGPLAPASPLSADGGDRGQEDSLLDLPLGAQASISSTLGRDERAFHATPSAAGFSVRNEEHGLAAGF